MFCFCNQTRSLKGGPLPPATKLRQGNVFTPVCHSIHRGGLCPSMHHEGHHDQGVSVQGGLCLGRSLSWGFLSRGSLSGGLCTGGLCVGGSLPGGLCTWGSLFGVSLSRGSLCWGVSVQWVSV